jgi:hypothetical protein
MLGGQLVWEMGPNVTLSGSGSSGPIDVTFYSDYILVGDR